MLQPVGARNKSGHDGKKAGVAPPHVMPGPRNESGGGSAIHTSGRMLQPMGPANAPTVMAGLVPAIHIRASL